MRLAVCDDNIKDIISEKSLLCSVLEELNIDGEIDTFLSGTELIDSNTEYQLIFLDIEMSDINGIQVAELIHRKNENCLICFITNHEHYIDAAMNKHAFRFWSKPVNRTQLTYAIKSAREEIESKKLKIILTSNNQKIAVYFTDIICAYTESRHTYIITTHGSYEVKEAFKYINEKLRKKYFARPHMSYCINMHYVVSFDRIRVTCEYENQRFYAPISRRMLGNFEKDFIKWTGDIL
ncbi:MAG: response regulator transcription factor [Clostridia bacterium]|nr:response regulator transcription factor [Clostridia bacterium]